MPDTCPICEMKFDPVKFNLVTCEVCGAEGSTACCMPVPINGSEVLCHNCDDDQ